MSLTKKLSAGKPNEPLYFSAFNPSAGDVTVNAYADCGNLVWSQVYSGDSFFGSIPAEITNQYDFDYISFDTSGGEMLAAGGGESPDAGGMALLGASSGGGGSIIRFPDPAEPSPHSGNIRALIILPIPLFNRVDVRQIMAVQKAFKNRGIKYKRLREGAATYDRVAEYAFCNPIKYIYIDTHGGYGVNPYTGEYYFGYGILRTHIALADGMVVSIKQSDPGAPTWCKKLENGWEAKAKSFYLIGFTNLEFSYFDSCFSGRLMINSNDQLVEGQPGEIGQAYDAPVSDMTFALGLYDPTKNQAYHGWYDLVPIGRPPPDPEDDYQNWTHDEWEALGAEDNLEMAIMYAGSQQTHYEDPNDPVNAYRLKGQGEIDNIQLVGN